MRDKLIYYKNIHKAFKKPMISMKDIASIEPKFEHIISNDVSYRIDNIDGDNVLTVQKNNKCYHSLFYLIDRGGDILTSPLLSRVDENITEQKIDDIIYSLDNIICFMEDDFTEIALSRKNINRNIYISLVFVIIIAISFMAISSI